MGSMTWRSKEEWLNYEINYKTIMTLKFCILVSGAVAQKKVMQAETFIVIRWALPNMKQNAVEEQSNQVLSTKLQGNGKICSINDIK
mgnify:CR=1 FL=1